MFSFKNGDPIAVIEGGKYDGKLIRLVDIHNKPKLDFSKLTKKEQQQLSLLLNSDDDEDIQIPKKFVDFYNDHQNSTGELGDSIEITDGTIIPVPNLKTRDCYYVSGPSGSGKSTFTSNYARQWKKFFHEKDNHVVLFANVAEDAVLDKLNPLRIPLDQNLIMDPVQLNELSNCLVIFDDTDQLSDKDLQNAVNNLKNKILEQGRHNNIYCLITSHLQSDYAKTRTVLNESSHVVFFPGTNAMQIKKFLTTYVGLNSKQIQNLFNLQNTTRWICIKKTYPMLVIYEKGIFKI